MQVDFVSILAAILLVFPSLAAVVLFSLNRKLKRETTRLEGIKANLSQLLSDSKDQEHATWLSLMEATEAHMQTTEDLKAHYEQLLRAKDTELYDRRQSPLHDLHDDELILAVKREVTNRVRAARHAQLVANQVFGGVAHKIATAVGGACFRVVDHCKRGHGEFAQFGAYPANEKE